MADSWEFALERARGRWLTFLTDKSVFSPRLLEILKATFLPQEKVIGWSLATYYYESWHEPEKRNQLEFPPYTSKVLKFDARSRLAALCRLRPDGTHPLLANACYRRDVVGMVKRQAGRFIHPPFGDCSVCAAVLSVIEEYAYIDLPLVIVGASGDSTTGSFARRGEAFWAFMRDFLANDSFEHVPLSIWTGSNCYSESVLRARRAMGDRLAGGGWQWRDYFLRNYSELAFLARRGVDVSKEKEELLTRIRTQPFEIRARLRIHQLCWMLRTAVRAVIQRSQGLSRLESIVRDRNRNRVVRGADAGFGDILQAARYFGNVMFDKSERETCPNQRATV